VRPKDRWKDEEENDIYERRELLIGDTIGTDGGEQQGSRLSFLESAAEEKRRRKRRRRRKRKGKDGGEEERGGGE